MKTYDKLKQIANYNSVCLIGHISPDADALASMLVFSNFLKSYFKIKTIDIFAECNTPPENCLEMIGKTKINGKEKDYDVAIMMDSPNIDRLGIYKPLFEKAKLRIVIDHHQTNLFEGEINIVEKQSSTCEIVYSIFKHFKVKLNETDKSKIYAGIITDTNNFTVGNFNKKTFKIVSEIIDSINHEDIYNNFFGNNTLKNMQLLALSINNIITLNHGKILLSHITHEEASKLKATFDDFTGIVNRLATITNNLLVCFIYPKGNNYYVSMRAKNGLKVSNFAKENGGGGHDGAAAFLSNETLINIEQKVLNEFSKIIENNTISKKKIF